MEFWTALQGIATVAAVILALWLESQQPRRVKEEVDRRQREEQRRLYIDLSLRIAESFEHWTDNPQWDTDASRRIRACLSALPLAYLPVLRYKFGVWPDGRDEQAVVSYGENWHDKARSEIRGLLYNLTGAGTNQDYEPPGSPTLNRPKPPPTYP